jgi:hypothetical protein
MILNNQPTGESQNSKEATYECRFKLAKKTDLNNQINDSKQDKGSFLGVIKHEIIEAGKC